MTKIFRTISEIHTGQATNRLIPVVRVNKPIKNFEHLNTTRPRERSDVNTSHIYPVTTNVVSL